MRAVSPVLGSVLLVVITVACAVAVGLGVSAIGAPAPAPTAALDLTVDADTATLRLTHRGGDPLGVATLSLVVYVDGTRLRHQPPVPFVGARGFHGAPAGPFNAAGDGAWRAGEVATLRLAGTNAPLPAAGDRVEVRIYQDGRRVGGVVATAWSLTTTARSLTTTARSLTATAQPATATARSATVSVVPPATLRRGPRSRRSRGRSRPS